MYQYFGQLYTHAPADLGTLEMALYAYQSNFAVISQTHTGTLIADFVWYDFYLAKGLLIEKKKLLG